MSSSASENFIAFSQLLFRRRKVKVVETEKQAPMVLKGAEKEMAETSAQFRRYQASKRVEYQALRDGPRGDQVKRLQEILQALSPEPESAAYLLFFFESMDWFRECSEHYRAGILSMVDDAIVRMRIRDGRPPIDDALPGEDPTVFEICRARLAS